MIIPWLTDLEETLGIDLDMHDNQWQEAIAYGQALASKGQSNRDIGRAVIYSIMYGYPEGGIPGMMDNCVVFAEPTCGDWDCLNPQHQVVSLA